MQRRRLLATAIGTTATALVAAPAWAQGAAPIRLWVGVTPGGSTDTLAREIAPELGRCAGAVLWRHARMRPRS